MARILPQLADLVACDHAVAGHDGTMVDVNRELFIKPCTQQEIDFYEASIAHHPEFAEYMPPFMGTLTLSSDQSVSFEEQGASLIADAEKGLVRPASISKSKSKKIVTDKALVLENASAGFKCPNILDVKLGVRLWADDASADKKQRFDIVSDETTHKKFGFRIAGMRVWQGPGAVIDGGGFKTYDKDYGRFTINNDNVMEAFRDFIFTSSAGIDEELGKMIIQAFLVDLERIKDILEGQESRMFSASLLFVFEGDGEALRFAMEEASKSNVNGHTVTNGAGDSDDEDFEDDEDIAGPRIYSVKVIDFAHATWAPGMGPDENSLLGVRSVIGILKDLAQA